MKIALPSKGSQVDDHFGHCDFFTIFTVSTNRSIASVETLEAPEGCGCKSNIAAVLSDMGVTVMLAGNMGAGAVNVLNSTGIKVIRGCSGDIKDVATDFLEGRISDNEVLCSAHGGCAH